MSHLESASLYGQALIAELAHVNGETSPEIVSLLDTSLSLSVHLPRILLAAPPDPNLMLLLIRRLIEAHADTQDPLVDNELRRRRCVVYGWCRIHLKMWFLAAMRRRAEAAWGRGEWGGTGELAVDYAKLSYCFTRLWLAGTALRFGVRVTIDAPARDLLAASHPYLA